MTRILLFSSKLDFQEYHFLGFLCPVVVLVVLATSALCNGDDTSNETNWDHDEPMDISFTTGTSFKKLSSKPKQRNFASSVSATDMMCADNCYTQMGQSMRDRLPGYKMPSHGQLYWEMDVQKLDKLCE